MSDNHTDQNPHSADDVDARQVEGHQLKQSKQDADHNNPDVSHDERTEKVSQEEVDSFEQWEQDETSGNR